MQFVVNKIQDSMGPVDGSFISSLCPSDPDLLSLSAGTGSMS